jgi:hypothetical protein
VDFVKGDNRITSLSQAYRLDPGAGWDVPPGLLHAPGSLCTYKSPAEVDEAIENVNLPIQYLTYETLLLSDLVYSIRIVFKSSPQIGAAARNLDDEVWRFFDEVG